MTEQKLSRRDALKTLAALGGAVTLAGLPRGWKTPVIDVGVLPAHAQVSAAPTLTPETQPPLTVLASWDMPEDTVDVDLMVWDPGGSGEVVAWDNVNGPTATHSGDNIDTDPARNWEAVNVPAGGGGRRRLPGVGPHPRGVRGRGHGGGDGQRHANLRRHRADRHRAPR